MNRKYILGLTQEQAREMAADLIMCRAVRGVRVNSDEDPNHYPRNFLLAVDLFAGEEA